MPRGPVRIEWADAEHWPPGRFQPDTTYRIATIRPGIEIDASGTMLAFAAETGDNQPTGPVRPHQAVQLAASGFRRMIGPAVDHPDTEVGPPAVIAAVGARLERFATGNTPLLWLSTGQVDALAMSDITDSDLERAGQTDGALGPDGIVIFEEPVPLDVYELMAGDSDLRATLHGGIRNTHADGHDWIPLVTLSAQGLALSVWTPGIWSDARYQEGELLERIWRAARFLGTATSTDSQPTVDRAERRRRERDLARTPITRTASQRIVFIRDGRNATVRRQDPTDTGTRVAPHWRRGHIRWVPYGPRDAADRPERPVYIPPTLVNADLVAAGHPLARRIYAYSNEPASDLPD